MTPSDLLDRAWSYPLFEALYGRRSRRFGLGFEMPEGPFRYKSAHEPVPLNEIEEALLVGAGAGFSGLALWDLPTPAPYRRRSGRTFPTTRPGGHTALFLTNDEGLYVLDGNVAASKLREIKTPDERTELLEAYRAQRRELRRGRLDIPRRIPPMSGHDVWDSNRPGSTLFLPVCDVSASLISLIAQFVDPALRRYAPAGGGINIVDDRHAYRPAGMERWLKDDDLADFVDHLGPAKGGECRTLVGFSAGAGFTIRFAGGPYGLLFDRYVFLSPILPGAPTLRPNAGGWTNIALPRIVTIASLGRLGIHWFDAYPVISYAASPENTQGTASYSYRLATNFGAGRQFETYLRNISRPAVVMVGSADEQVVADQFAPLLQRLDVNIPVIIVPNMKHADMIVTLAALQAVVGAIAQR